MSGRVRRVSELTLLLIVAACAVWTVTRAVSLARTPLQLDYGESCILSAGVRIAHGLTPYPDPRQWPSAFNLYGPLPYAGTAVLVKVCGLSFTAPRLFSLASGLAVAFLLALVGGTVTRRWLPSIGFACLYLCFPPVSTWLCLLRVDFSCIACSLAGLYCFITRPRWWPLATVLFFVAFFTKMNYLSAPAACALWMIAHREWKRLLQMALLGASLTVAGVAVVQLWSRGFFLFNLLQTHPDPFALTRLASTLYGNMGQYAPMALLTAVALFCGLRGRRSDSADRGDVLLIFIPIALLGTVTAGKLGASGNHLLEGAAALCLGSTLGWCALADLVTTRPALNAAVALAGAAALGAFVLVAYEPPPLARYIHPGCFAAYEFVRQVPGEAVLSENVGAVLLAGKPVQMSDPFVYTQLVEQSGWSDAALMDRVRARSFAAILLLPNPASGRWPKDMLPVMRQNYRQVASFDCWDMAAAYEPLP